MKKLKLGIPLWWEDRDFLHPLAISDLGNKALWFRDLKRQVYGPEVPDLILEVIPGFKGPTKQGFGLKELQERGFGTPRPRAGGTWDVEVKALSTYVHGWLSKFWSFLGPQYNTAPSS